MAGGNQFNRVQPGERRHLPAAVWNAMLDTVAYVDGLKASGGALRGKNTLRDGIVPVRNDTGYDCDRFSVLGIDGPIFTPLENIEEFKNQVALVGVVPGEEHYVGRCCVLLEPVPADEIGLALVSGVVPVRILAEGSSSGFLTADIEPGECGYMRLDSSGPACVLWKEPVGLVRWAIVRLGNAHGQFVAFELKDDLTPGGYTDAYPLSCDYGYWTCDYDENSLITVYDLPGKRRALGKDSVGSYLDGARGWAQWSDVSQSWEIIDLQTLAVLCNCTAVEDFEESDSSVTVQYVEPQDGGQCPLLSGDYGDQLSVSNTMGFAGDADAPGVIKLNANTGDYELLQMKCPTHTESSGE